MIDADYWLNGGRIVDGRLGVVDGETVGEKFLSSLKMPVW